jgi:GR25 family glycosyltransferase involved in LPS biosynthesis
MRITVKNEVIEFQIIDLEITNRDQENIFIGNKKTLLYRLNKAILNPKDYLHSIAQQQRDKYPMFHNMNLGEFIFILKSEGNLDYKLYLNKYGDKKYCNYSIRRFQNDKGIYCYIVEDRIIYVGRSKNTFIRRFKDYGNITPYNCLINGQATNCNINSRVNELDNIKVGFYLMNNSTNEQIEKLEQQIINTLKIEFDLWNIQFPKDR